MRRLVAGRLEIEFAISTTLDKKAGLAAVVKRLRLAAVSEVIERAAKAAGVQDTFFPTVASMAIDGTIIGDASGGGFGSGGSGSSPTDMDTDAAGVGVDEGCTRGWGSADCPYRGLFIAFQVIAGVAVVPAIAYVVSAANAHGLFSKPAELGPIHGSQVQATLETFDVSDEEGFDGMDLRRSS
jgi:hypothetical protein